MALENSPHLFVENIATPMLVIHGDKDYRVPIGAGLRLWYELLSKSQLAADEQGQTPHRFLCFPEENPWILSPHHAKVWYQVVLGFLDEHVVGAQAAQRPEVLGWRGHSCSVLPLFKHQPTASANSSASAGPQLPGS